MIARNGWPTIRAMQQKTIKASVFPLLFHGLEAPEHNLHAPRSGFVSDIANDARDIYVRLEKTDEGWHFKEMQQKEVQNLENSQGDADMGYIGTFDWAARHHE